MQSVVFHPTLAKSLMALAYTRIARRPAVFAGGPVTMQEILNEPLSMPTQVRVRCKLAGVCGTDLSLLHFKVSMRSASMARKRYLTSALCMGHEAIGEVIETGSAVTSLSKGDRVVMIAGACCAAMRKEPCALCAAGLPLLCLRRDEFAPRPSDGAAWSTEFVRDESQLLKIPESVSDEQAALVEPLACAAHAVLRRPPSAGDNVIVIGCGTIGLGMILVLRTLDIPVRILALARHTHQRAVAEAFGADRVIDFSNAYEELARETNSEILARAQNRILHPGAARAYDAVGSGETIGHALRWVRPRGAVVVEGITPAPNPRDCSPVWLREIDLIGSHGYGIEQYEGRAIHTFQLIVDWLAQKKLKPERLISHRFPLREFRKAVRVASDKGASGAIKVLLNA
ncbi:MAG TPA: alcohol dehydrogenase catalytic domain-containing protein [Verrucomicrobiae bacterium]